MVETLTSTQASALRRILAHWECFGRWPLATGFRKGVVGTLRGRSLIITRRDGNGWARARLTPAGRRRARELLRRDCEWPEPSEYVVKLGLTEVVHHATDG